LICERYERGSIVLTSNKRFSEWGELIGDETLAAAILDRLLHHATTISITGESYRLKDKRRAGVYRRLQTKRKATCSGFPIPARLAGKFSPEKVGNFSPELTPAGVGAICRSRA